MRLTTLLGNVDIYGLFESVLADFLLAFTFFTSLCYAVLGKRFGMQRPAAAMSATLGFAFSIGLIWWERATGFSIRDLGPIAIGFAIIAVAFVMYQAIRQIGGSWSGAAITLGVSILIARLLELNIPIDEQIIQVVTMVALVVGILALVSYTRGHSVYLQPSRARPPEVRHDMTDLYRDRNVSNQLTKKMKKLRKTADTLNERPQEAVDVLPQLRRMLPAEGYVTEKMAQLRAKAHQIRNGHIARLEETRQVFAGLPTSAKKKASAELAAGYRQIIGIDTRLERLDKAVAENERRIIELTRNAQQYARRYDHRQLTGCLKAAEKLQHHNSRLIKLIQRTESKLSAVASKVAQETRQVNNK
jgi:endonuclease III